MNLLNAMDITFEQVTVLGHPMLFTFGRIDRDTIPKGLYVYDVRHDDETQGNPVQIGKWIGVNHLGTVVSNKPIRFETGALFSNAFLDIDPEEDWDWGFDEMTLLDYVKENPYMNINVKPCGNGQLCDCGFDGKSVIIFSKAGEALGYFDLEEVNKMAILKDSGERTEFSTGAVRDMHSGKGRFDLLPWNAIHDVAKHCEDGALKYGERNVDKGIPQHSLIDSAIRHLTRYIRNEMDEPHLRAAAWNILWALEQETTHPELIDLPGRGKVDISKE